MTTILVGTIASPPSDDGVMVVLPQLDGGADRHGPCSWQQRPDDIEPARGDRCVVLEDTDGGMWILGWRPA